jgi:hypothetical protein
VQEIVATPKIFMAKSVTSAFPLLTITGAVLAWNP